MLGLLPAIFAVLVVTLASLLSTYTTARQNALNDVESQAMVVADNTGAGLAFGDRQVVDEIIGALDVRPNIDMVCVYDQTGRARVDPRSRGDKRRLLDARAGQDGR